MNKQLLFSLLDANMGYPLTHQLALSIMQAASMVEPLITDESIASIQPKEHEGMVFSVEKMENIFHEMRQLHREHWDETEAHRHGLQFNPDYSTFIQYEQARRYILFTVRDLKERNKLVGNCAMYLDRSTHTQTMLATEDTLYIYPSYRRGTIARAFIAYCEAALRTLGVKEITVTVKTVNRAGLFFQRLGYRHVENGLTKVLEAENA